MMDRGIHNGRYILDAEGNAVAEPDLFKWAEWLENTERHVADDHLPGEIRVSTVFLCLDHRFMSDGPPVLWETLIFGGPHDGEGERYTSREDAIAGHAKYLALATEAPRA